MSISCLKIGNMKSKSIPMLIGVPQSLILGPLLFSIHIKDLLKSCPKLNCIMYANDTTLCRAIENFDRNIIECK